MPEKGSLPSSYLLYHSAEREANGKQGRPAGKNAPDRNFIRMVKFAGQVSEGKGKRPGVAPRRKNEKPHPGRTSDAA